MALIKMKNKEYGNIQDLAIYNTKSHVISFKKFTRHSCTINHSCGQITMKINSNLDLTFWHITYADIDIYRQKKYL